MIVSLRLFQCVYSINTKLNIPVLFPGINFHGSNHSLVISRILLCLHSFLCVDNLNLLNLFIYLLNLSASYALHSYQNDA